MTLLEEVRGSFESSRERQEEEHEGPLVMVSDENEIAPGFNEMRRYYNERMVVITRRVYRYHAGSTMPEEGMDLIGRTHPQMRTPLIAMLMEAFCCGVMVGQNTEHLVQMHRHFNSLDQLFASEPFHLKATTMARGFADDEGVTEFFDDYVIQGLHGLSHMTGFAHGRHDPGKVWDLWILIGNSCTSGSYLAGYTLGELWRQRDVLDGIQIATEGDTP